METVGRGISLESTLYENLIGKILNDLIQDTVGCSISSSSCSQIIPSGHGRKDILCILDFVIFKDTSPLMIVDAKNSTSNNFMSNFPKDLKKIIRDCLAFRCRVGILVYNKIPYQFEEFVQLINEACKL